MLNFKEELSRVVEYEACCCTRELPIVQAVDLNLRAADRFQSACCHRCNIGRRYPVLVAIDSINAFDYTSGFGNPNAERFTGELMPARNLSLTEIFYHHKQPGLVRRAVSSTGRSMR